LGRRVACIPRQSGRKNIARIHEQWRTTPDFDFDRVVDGEHAGFAETTLGLYVQFLERQARVYAGQEPFDPDAFFPTPSADLVLAIQHRLRESGASEENIWPRTAWFLRSPGIANVPYMKISALLFAAMARKAAAGQVRPPSRGMLNDVKTVATVLPYCDAIFVDNEIAALLAEEPLRTRIDFGTRVFSLNSREEFIAYLDDIRESAGPEHVELITQVYGDKWIVPYADIFRDERDDE
jgi:hypothetical protein